MRLFSEIFKTMDELNEKLLKMKPEATTINNDEWVALMGRYGSSHIRYNNEGQFMAMFFTILQESLEKLRAKLSINTKLRTMDESEALNGDVMVVNNATNPDTEPSTEDFSPLPYINSQTAQKTKYGKVSGYYQWKHSVGGQAYNEFLDSFKYLFRVLLTEDYTVYGE